LYCALLEGLDRAAGLDVVIVQVGPNTFVVQRLATGQGEFGLGSTDDVLLAVDRGIPLVAVGATMQHDPQGIMVHAASAVRGFADLEGRTIAVTPGAAWLKYLVKKYGLKRLREIAHTYSTAAFVRDPDYIQQCFITSEPFFAQQAGVPARVLLIKDSGYAPYRVFFTRRDFLRAQSEAVRAFTAASIRGWAAYLDDPAEVHAEILRRNPELDAEKMEFSLAALRRHRFITGDPEAGEAAGRLTEARWQFQHDILRELGVIRGRFPVTDAFTREFLPPEAR
ncbi:MAG TPA: ABC transporter substrate-binding protein, partial [Verrucomicrobiota bacterium]|nr:ABC transporter substrate-binding protein [Verrucomicrobiota bacterium]